MAEDISIPDPCTEHNTIRRLNTVNGGANPDYTSKQRDSQHPLMIRTPCKLRINPQSAKVDPNSRRKTSNK